MMKQFNLPENNMRSISLALSICAIASGAAHAHVTLERQEAAIGASYKAVFRVPRKKGKGCFKTTVARVTALGYVTWHGATPANRLCA